MRLFAEILKNVTFMCLPTTVFGKIALHSVCSNVIEETISSLVIVWVLKKWKKFVMKNTEKNLNRFFFFLLCCLPI